MSVTSHYALRFALVGVSNTVVGFAVIWLALRGFGFSDIAANATGYAVGFVWGFVLNRAWTFSHRGALHASFPRYVVVCLVAYAANLVVLLWLSRQLGPGSLVSQFFGILTYSTLAYLGARRYAFRDSRSG